MGEFFRGWKRKTGCVTLVMALAFTGGWLRSLRHQDTFGLIVGDETVVSLLSDYGEIGSMCVWEIGDAGYASPSVTPPMNLRERVFWETEIIDAKMASTEYLTFDLSERLLASEWTYHWNGFRFGATKSGPDVFGVAALTAPYWSIVIPLTLLSAYLLLSNPRKSNQKKITETIPADGA